MAKPKAQTIQQRFGFMDDDLKKPKHDEVMQWLNDCVDEKLLEWLGIPGEWTNDEISRLKRSATEERESKIQKLNKDLEREKATPDDDPYLSSSFYNLTPDEKEKRNEKYRFNRAERISSLEKQIEQASVPIKGSPIPAKPPVQITTKQWERPIKSNDYIIGFIDMAVFFELPELNIHIELAENNWNVTWSVQYSSYDGYEKNCVYFEVKTEIPSLGELIRQVNMYKSYGAKRIFVVAPDDTHEKTLREQGIGLIKFA